MKVLLIAILSWRAIASCNSSACFYAYGILMQELRHSLARHRHYEGKSLSSFHGLE
jgi:hypothetical protein